MSQIIAISNHKGGVGKTTSTVNIGAALALKNFRVLLVDLDPQANLTQNFRIKDIEISIYDNLKGGKTVVPKEVKKNLCVIPSSLDLSAAEIELSSEPGREYVLKDILSTLESKFDYILIDCPPSLGLLTINALTAANKVIIPLQAEFFPLKGLDKLKEVIKKIKNRLNPNLEIACVFLTKYDYRKVLNRDVSEAAKNFFGDKLLETTISSNIAVAEAQAQGMDVFLYNRSCKGAKDYKDLCDEIINKGVF